MAFNHVHFLKTADAIFFQGSQPQKQHNSYYKDNIQPPSTA